MHVLHISASHAEKHKHAFSYHFKHACEKIGIKVRSITPYDGSVVSRLKKGESFRDSYIGKKPFPLSRLVKSWPETDFVFVENPKWFFVNDTNTVVAYYHRDLQSPIYVKDPTYLILRFWTTGKSKDGRPSGGQPENLELYRPDVWYDKDIQKLWLCNAISEEEFGGLNSYKDHKRQVHGFAYMGSYITVKEMMTFNTRHYLLYKHHQEIIDYVKKKNLAKLFQNPSGSFNNYKRHLFTCDATLIIPAWESWETRRLYEASFCRCVPILFIQNENARKILEAQGYEHGKTCITFTRKEDLATLKLEDYDLEQIRTNGLKLVKERHTYRSRVVELLNKIDYEGILKNRGKLGVLENRVFI